jgi:hypothetical protein
MVEVHSRLDEVDVLLDMDWYRVVVTSYLLSPSFSVSVHMIFCLKKVFNFGGRGIDMDPTPIVREAHTIPRNTGTDEPIGHCGDRFFAGCKCLDDLLGSEVLAKSG